jgi:hypothetical protein
MEDVDIFCGHLVYITAFGLYYEIWYILRPIGIIYG